MIQNRYGIFVSYRHTYSFFAGRIYDYLNNKGMLPYMDVYQMKQVIVLDELIKEIKESPYFLLVLDNNCFKGLTKDDIFYKEIETALECKSAENFLIVCSENFSFSAHDDFPDEFKSLKDHQYDTITHKYFAEDMERFIRNINLEEINDIIWKDYMLKNATTLICPRNIIESKYASLENRFGKELVDSVKNCQHYTGCQIIKRIRMSCYAASIIFNPDRSMVDDKAFDNGILFNTFGELLRDPSFRLEILINAPNSLGAKEAISNGMLGNNSLEHYPEAVFLAAYAGLDRLINEVPEFKAAYKENRFHFYLTDIPMTGSIFQVEYKTDWSEFDHVKYDFYSYGIDSGMDRLSMVFFKSDNRDNYNFIINSYIYIKSRRYSESRIKKNRAKWLSDWEQLKEKL